MITRKIEKKLEEIYKAQCKVQDMIYDVQDTLGILWTEDEFQKNWGQFVSDQGIIPTPSQTKQQLIKFISLKG